ncbi:SET domain-containing protein 8-like [Teratosphaeria destructans]|uniref:SET domain-containing protein 8-like n=1 Tax=Teratosphaeria destructans TaxID=418781 RepID=A0A9W7W0U8_9PEZI|nr:SET domain-containing protein 8-like [Teratosphaeria destructans]
MIRDGKTSGWLTLQPEAVQTWAEINGVDFRQTKPGTAVGRGGALLAKEDIAAPKSDLENLPVLLTVPKELILSAERIREHSNIDQDLRQVLESIGDFASVGVISGFPPPASVIDDCQTSTPRGAILVFLLVQASVSCPHLTERVSVHTPFTDYIKSLPMERLPTFWTEAELSLLVGTTLAPAVISKLRSLQREYDTLYDDLLTTRWYRLVSKHFTFDDWKQVDAMYRSRALDFPDIGHCMVPMVDLANHSAGEPTIAVYEKDSQGDAVLQLREGKSLKKGDEVTITYGDEKGACEMLFSYGFLEHDRTSAETLFLSLAIQDDDVYRSAKMRIADCAPGFKLIDTGDGEVDWTGDFIWLLCVGHDEGLRFELARLVDSEDEEMHAFFNGQELNGGAQQLRQFLAQHELWDVFRLRAVALLQQRILDQGSTLQGTQEVVEGLLHGDGTDISDRVFGQAMQLRKLERDLLEKAYEDFERQVSLLFTIGFVCMLLDTCLDSLE